MLANLIKLVTGHHSGSDYEREFIADVTPSSPPETRSRRSELILVLGWLLVLLKCLATAWAVRAYDVPVHAGWVIVPTLLAAGVCTWLYLSRTR